MASVIMLRVVKINIINLDVLMPSVPFLLFSPTYKIRSEIGALMSTLFYDCATWVNPMLIFFILDANMMSVIMWNAIALLSFC